MASFARFSKVGVRAEAAKMAGLGSFRRQTWRAEGSGIGQKSGASVFARPRANISSRLIPLAGISKIARTTHRPTYHCEAESTKCKFLSIFWGRDGKSSIEEGNDINARPGVRGGDRRMIPDPPFVPPEMAKQEKPQNRGIKKLTVGEATPILRFVRQQRRDSLGIATGCVA